MDWHRLLDVLTISIPVFALIGLGKLLSRRRILTEDRSAFVNWLLYNLALPAIIFREVAALRYTSLLNGGLIVAPICAAVALSLLLALYVRLRGFERGLGGVLIICAFWANTAYMGFPLTLNAFGDEGLGLAAVYNAVTFPTFFFLAHLVLQLCSPGEGGGWWSRMRGAIINPVVLSAVAGIVVSVLSELARDPAGELSLPVWAAGALDVLEAFLKLLGSMGFPLALLMIGAALRAQALRGRWEALTVSVLGKLVLSPLLVLLLLRLLFPDIDHTVNGVAILLTAMPTAVASYVLSRQAQVEESFVSSVLVVSTLASVLSLPVWIYVLL